MSQYVYLLQLLMQLLMGRPFTFRSEIWGINYMFTQVNGIGIFLFACSLFQEVTHVVPEARKHGVLWNTVVTITLTASLQSPSCWSSPLQHRGHRVLLSLILFPGPLELEFHFVLFSPWFQVFWDLDFGFSYIMVCLSKYLSLASYL